MPKRIAPGRQESPFFPDASALKRFFGKIEDDGKCWMWTGHTDRAGYGQFKYQAVVWWAHRFALVALGQRELPAGYEVDHTCRRPGCVNPAHLRTVEMKENRRTNVRDIRRGSQSGTLPPVRE